MSTTELSVICSKLLKRALLRMCKSTSEAGSQAGLEGSKKVYADHVQSPQYEPQQSITKKEIVVGNLFTKKSMICIDMQMHISGNIVYMKVI